jgi:chromosome segregation ATPase
LLTEHIRNLKADLAVAKESYAGVKVELLDQAIAQGAMKENERKAREELEEEKARSRSLSTDVEDLKKALWEKEDAILQLRKLIEDLRVEKTEMASSYKEIKRANTDLVGENMSLEEKIHGKLLLFYACFSNHTHFL